MEHPKIYDVSTDQYRYVTQNDVDHMQINVDHMQIMLEIEYQFRNIITKAFKNHSNRDKVLAALKELNRLCL